MNEAIDKEEAKNWSEKRIRFELDLLEKEYDRCESEIRSYDDCPHDPIGLHIACNNKFQITSDIDFLRKLLRSKL
jgi:hypothetical protein